MKVDIFNKISDDSFRVKAFAEYCVAAQERYSTFYSQYCAFATTFETEHTLEPDEVAALVNDFMDAQGIKDNIIALDSGYVSIRALLTATAMHINHNDIALPGDTTGGVYAEFQIATADATGVKTTDTSTTIAEIADSMKSQLHSIACLASAATAYEEAKGSVSDAIVIFNDKLNDIFSEAHADISNSAQYMKGLLSIKDPSQFISSALTVSGITRQANAQPEDDVRPMDNDIAHYTGASPAGPLNFSAVHSAVISTAKAAASVVSGIVSGLASVARRLFSSAVSYVHNVLVDPMDLEVSNSKGFGTVDGFQYQMADGPMLTYASSDIAFTNEELLENYGNKWFAMKTRFGEWLFRIQRIGGASGVGRRMYGDVIYKPRIVNFNKLRPLFGPRNERLTFGDLNDILDEVAKLGDDLYDISGLSEREAFRGLVYSSEVEAALLGCAELQILRDTTDSTYVFPEYLNAFYVDNDEYGNIPESISNLDWVAQFSGYSPTSQEFTNTRPYYLGFGPDYAQLKVVPILNSILRVLSFQKMHPLEPIPFIPYSNNHTDLATPSYRIKTDEENQQAFQKFVAVAITVAVVAIVATSAIVLVKRIARANYFKRARTVGQLDNKMWSGGVLTPQEQKQYVKASKKMSRSNVLGAGLSNPVDPSSDNSRSDYNVNILPYIIGETSLN